MPKQKYDYGKLKQEYLMSDIQELKEFLQNKYGFSKIPWNFAKATMGWRAEKQKFLDWVVQKQLERQQKQMAKEFRMPTSTLLKMKKAWLELLAKRLTEFLPQKNDKGEVVDDWDPINVRDIKMIIDTIKTELWEPTTIWKNENLNKTEPLDESKFIQD